MTLLANEAGRESSDILKKYNKPKAKNHADLEVKLAELYFEQPDKLQIEKELANIHPHKKWLIKSLNLVEKEKCKECSEFTGDCKCEKPNETQSTQIETPIKEIVVSDSTDKFSDFVGSNNPNSDNSMSTKEILGMIGIFGIIGLTFIVVSKNIK